jgi:hypothetical protein
MNQSYAAAAVGSCELIHDAAVIVVDNEDLLGLSVVDEWLAVSVTLYDEDGQLLLPRLPAKPRSCHQKRRASLAFHSIH